MVLPNRQIARSFFGFAAPDLSGGQSARFVNRFTHSLAGAVLLVLLTLFAVVANAADLYWDTNGTTLNAGTTAGIWGTDNFWNSDSTGGGAGSFTTATTADDNLFFSAGTNTGATGIPSNISLAAVGLLANKITFDDPLAAATNLTLSDWPAVGTKNTTRDNKSLSIGNSTFGRSNPVSGSQREHESSLIKTSTRRKVEQPLAFQMSADFSTNLVHRRKT